MSRSLLGLLSGFLDLPVFIAQDRLHTAMSHQVDLLPFVEEDVVVVCEGFQDVRRGPIASHRGPRSFSTCHTRNSATNVTLSY